MSAVTNDSALPEGSLLPDAERRQKLRKIRAFRDGFSRYGVGAGGLGVIFALALIFIYLFYETFPLLKPVSVGVETEYTVPGDEVPAPTLHLTLDRYEQIGARFSKSGTITFFDANTGGVLERLEVPIPEGERITAFDRAESRRSLFVFGYSDGGVLPVKVEYPQTFVGGVRHIHPELSYPLGEEPIRIGAGLVEDYSALAVVEGRGGYIVAGGTEEGEIAMALFSTRRNMMTGEVEIRRSDYDLPDMGRPVRQILLPETLRNVFVIDDRGHLFNFNIVDRNNPFLVEEVELVGDGARVTASEFLVGSRSLIVGGSDGSVRQWFLVRDEDSGQSHMTFIRGFRGHDAPVTFIEPESIRKGFLTGAEDGSVGLHFATSSVTLAMKSVSDVPVARLAMGPNNRRALVKTEDSDVLRVLAIDNPHPQTTLSALWGRVWYEGRGEPEFIWQSSSADDAFEPKLSIVPLSVGTLKAALFAMLLATPLAIMGAIYTAYFMAPAIRRVVKPSIELMEALPTVILGFLAGIWLAPYIENNLPILITGVILFPLAVLIAGFAWSRLPQGVKSLVPSGWEAALLVPVVILTGWIVVTSSPWIEVAFFDGSMRQWFTDVGIPYDQRNALIVGMAMGFAVIPTIFSIAEDAVFNVPKHLTNGSLALGATPWQTVTGVVLLTASPGIFSAVMIGFGRAVGETMIVLMASGNSPVVNFNLFEGMRTLAANIAVELPETAVGSTHFRVLFLSALVLLVFTFLLNTAAEIVRQRLRKRYASL
ncbi:ABC transporter permease subunit [Thioalkalivibrio paradoxus]|uniref:Phosphate ABC transporter permease n=1 Tax=Thioalkalivibrio paradoxus ARh 1 TaxID=713585 RepID=W0DP93_9GAMM|nr:ABC transporter permease subunit [Thioalkalivibrio paradoxus]AHE98818.1 phosphate ABC transporter permease [Thioalkalivibrio paradoxus ARh 1]